MLCFLFCGLILKCNDIHLLEHEEAELDQLAEGVVVCLDHPVEVLIDLNLGAYFLLNKMPPSSSLFRAWFKRFFSICLYFAHGCLFLSRVAVIMSIFDFASLGIH
jgi:hypothetical protein